MAETKPSRIRTFINKVFQNKLKTASLTDRKNAMSAYKAYASSLSRLDVNGNELMGTNPRKLFVRVGIAQIGRLCMFYYDPKTKAKLPYYDRFPMIMPIEIYNNGFLGLNFHYISNRQRAMLMDAINDRVINNRHLNQRQKIKLSYKIMKTVVRVPQYIPTIKRYLYSHLRSKIHVIEPDAWHFALFLPVERFEKASTGRVHKESMRKIQNYGAF